MSDAAGSTGEGGRVTLVGTAHVSETSVREVESFLRRNECRIYFERRGATTDLVVVADRG